MSETSDRRGVIEVHATVSRSRLDHRTWVPFLPDTDVHDCLYAGPLGKVKDAALERAQEANRVPMQWVREGDDWLLIEIEEG